ncbi:hypothetical protein N9F34_03860 [Alphaproteobacteria bacterium]|nr:hypothetical protein [Alphaproteobacteria bacterium]
MPTRKIKPPKTVGDCIHEAGYLYRDARAGNLDSLTAVRLAGVLTSIRQHFEPGGFEERLKALESTARKIKNADQAS